MFENLNKLGKFDPIAIADLVNDRLPGRFRSDKVRMRMLDVLLNIGVPFNRWLGMRIREFSPQGVTIESPPTVLRRNHVGTAHACAQALIGEYACGLLVAQHYPIDAYRMIIARLEIDYMKAGPGILTGHAEAPEVWPDLKDQETWVDMQTTIRNDKGEVVSVCKTRWQVKSWAKVKEKQAQQKFSN